MDEYRHHVSGFFAHREEAEGAVTRLVERGLPRDQLQLFDADSGPVVAEPKGESNEVLNKVLVDGAIGTVVGTGIGALAQLALVAGSVSLFVASPLVAPLVMLGWGASLGAFVGAAAGANTGVEHKDGWLIWSMTPSPMVRLSWLSRPGVLTRRPSRAKLSGMRWVSSRTLSVKSLCDRSLQ